MTTDDDDVLRRALDQTAGLLEQVSTDHAADPTPCADWTLEDLSRHVVAGPARFVAMFDGEKVDWASSPPLGDDPAGDFRTGAAALVDRLAQTGGAAGTDDAAGPGPAIPELAVHAWDLSQALGLGAPSDDGVAEAALAFMQENLTPERRGDVFGPRVRSPTTPRRTSAWPPSPVATPRPGADPVTSGDLAIGAVSIPAGPYCSTPPATPSASRPTHRTGRRPAHPEGHGGLSSSDAVTSATGGGMAKQPQVPNVRTWSSKVPAHQAHLADLDVYLLKEHRDVLTALGRERLPQGEQGGASWERDAALSLLPCLLLPITGVIAFTGGRDSTGREVDGLATGAATTVAALCFAVAFIAALRIAVRWWRTGRQRSTPEVVALAAAALLAASALRLLEDARGEAALFAPAALPVWGTGIVAGVMLVLECAASTGPRTYMARHFRVVGPPDPQRVMALLGRLDPQVVDKLLKERDRAIARLQQRGVIDEDQARQVAGVPMGLSPTLPG